MTLIGLLIICLVGIFYQVSEAPHLTTDPASYDKENKPTTDRETDLVTATNTDLNTATPTEPSTDITVTTPDSSPAIPETLPPTPSLSCVRAGCSGQLCVSSDQADIVSTCEWREEYACYQEATCEQQADGQCGFTPSATLSACLSNPTLE